MSCGSCFIIGVASICILFPSGLVKRLMRSRKWGYESFLILWSDFVKIQLTNVSEFTNSRTNISNFTNSRTIFCLFTIHEQHRFHEFTNDFFGFHEFTNEKKPIPACTNTAGGASLPSSLLSRVPMSMLFDWYLLTYLLPVDALATGRMTTPDFPIHHTRFKLTHIFNTSVTQYGVDECCWLSSSACSAVSRFPSHC